MNLSTIIKSQVALKKLGVIDLPVVTGLQVLKVIRDTADHVLVFQAKHKDLFEKFGDKEEETGTITVSTDNREDFNAGLEELLATEVEFPVKKIPIGALGDGRLTAADLDSIEWLLDLS
jgi:hypothetical protein